MLLSNVQTCLSDKIPPSQKKLKFKKIVSNLQCAFLFFNFNFLGGHFVTKVSLHF
jgi:hypothetical protein